MFARYYNLTIDNDHPDIVMPKAHVTTPGAKESHYYLIDCKDGLFGALLRMQF